MSKTGDRQLAAMLMVTNSRQPITGITAALSIGSAHMIGQERKNPKSLSVTIPTIIP